MPRDKRLYAQFTLNYLDSHKIAILSDAAIVTHIRMVLWSRRELTDGHIKGPMALVLAKGKRRVLEELLTNDPERPSLVKVGDDYIVHDFGEHQMTNETIAERSAIYKQNGTKGGRPAKQPVTNLVTDSEAKKSRVQSTEIETTANAVVTPPKRGTRIPEPFIVTGEMRQWAATRCPGVSVDSSTEKFVNYWRARTRDATKLDWRATWDNWLISDFEKLRPEKPTKRDQVLDVLEMGRRMQEEDDRKAVSA